MTTFAPTHIQFVLRQPSQSCDQRTALVYGLLTADARLPDKSMVPVAIDSMGILLGQPATEDLTARLKRVDRDWSFALQELHDAPVFRSPEEGLTGGEIVLYETEIPAAQGSKVFAFLGLWRGSQILLDALAERRFSAQLAELGENFVADLDPNSAQPYAFERGGIPSDALRKPIWDSEVGLVGLRSLECLAHWRERVVTTADALEGRPLKAQAGSQLKNQEYLAYLKALNKLVPEILPLSWISADQFAQLKAAQVQAFKDAHIHRQ